MRIGSLCTGYDGLGMAVRSVLGGETVWHSEVDDDACKVLAHHNPDVPNLGDMTAIDWSAVPPVDVLEGGTPCQDVSHAGARKGMRAGTRSGLWSAMADAIEVLRPRLVVWENVGGVLSAGADSGVELCAGCVGDEPGVHLRALGRVLGDLADLGYDARWCGLRASDVGAPHGRLRVFVTAQDTHGPARGERRLATSGQAEGRGARPDTGGRGGTPAADPYGGKLQRRGIGGDLAAAPGAAEGPRGERERHGHTAGDRRPTAPDADSDGLGRLEGPPPGRHEVHDHERSDADGRRDGVNWGPYGPAVQRWEHVLGRSAPLPTEPGRGGQPRLSPPFVEWLMGLPVGHVTAVPDLSRNAQLRILGNGVVPQQAAAALRWLLCPAAEAAA